RRADPPREVEVKNLARMEAYIKRTVALFDQLTQAKNLQPRLLIMESLDIADPGFNQAIDRIHQAILNRSL
ncbi:MAG: hypothetical protein J0653_06440, partial [Deltaproteobacteria bacterium]|nr:hypothetical protein [Deltaproteobacteria bacterium]